MNGGNLTANPLTGFVYEQDGIRVEVLPCIFPSQYEAFYNEVDALMDALLNKKALESDENRER